MKRFFISFLGAMAAVWVSIIIATLGLIGLIAAISAAKINTGAPSVSDKSVLVLDLGESIDERADAKPSAQDIIMGEIENTITLEKVVTAIREAANDKKIVALYIEAGGGAPGLAQSNAIIKAINEFKKSGKKVYAYANETFAQTDYFIASTADSIFLNPVGMIDVHGISTQVMYFKDFLDKLGITVDIMRVGTYKSAVEPFMLNHMSPASREQIEAYISSIWSDMRSTIAKNRKVTPEAVNLWADSLASLKPAEYYISQHMVDGLLYRHQMTERLRSITEVDDNEEPNLISIQDYYSAKTANNKAVKGKHIAVLYAVGDIVNTGSEGISAEKIVPEIEALADDEDVVGLILRVNSPGGSASASEQIWEALQTYKAKTGNPFFVSMSDVAASGGYYISCGADKIFAEPLTITGSIGIFGMVPNLSGLVTDKLGVNVDEVSTNPTGAMPSLFTPMTPTLRNSMQRYVERGYDLFTRRCADGRHMSQDSIKVIAEGRVWDGRAALRIGLVDQLGGLDLAVAEMATMLDIDKSQVRSYPKEKINWWTSLASITNSLEDRITARRLGSAYPFYKQVQALQNTSLLQARMESGMPQ